jgi:hypothetical protein
MHGPINVKSPNNISKWQMEFNSAFKGLIQWVFGFYPRIKLLVLDIDSSPPSTVEVKVSGSAALFLLYNFMLWTGITLLLKFVIVFKEKMSVV